MIGPLASCVLRLSRMCPTMLKPGENCNLTQGNAAFHLICQRVKKEIGERDQMEGY